MAGLAAVIAAVYTYKTEGAGELRTKIYQPLFDDLSKAGATVESVSESWPPPMNSLLGLQRSGDIARIPEGLRSELVSVKDRIYKFYSTISPAREVAIREMSARLSGIRTEEADAAWGRAAQESIQHAPKRGFADALRMQFRHEYRSRIVDVRDPSHPKEAGPGGPIFVLRDWVLYPSSVADINAMWLKDDFLYFNEHKDEWYWRMTHGDLAAAGDSLADFLRPTHELLSKTREFRFLVANRPGLLTDITRVKAEVLGRVGDPKRIGDLL